MAPRDGKGLASGFPPYSPEAPESHPKQIMLAKIVSLLCRTKPPSNQTDTPKALPSKNSVELIHTNILSFKNLTNPQNIPALTLK